MITGSAQRLPWTLAVPIPSTASGSFSTDRRTLYRALAVIVALAAMTPLFAGLEPDRTPGNPTPQMAVTQSVAQATR